jgi:hypothetical protein
MPYVVRRIWSSRRVKKGPAQAVAQTGSEAAHSADPIDSPVEGQDLLDSRALGAGDQKPTRPTSRLAGLPTNET